MRSYVILLPNWCEAGQSAFVKGVINRLTKTAERSSPPLHITVLLVAHCYYSRANHAVPLVKVFISPVEIDVKITIFVQCRSGYLAYISYS